MEQSRERSSVVAIEKGAFGSLATMVANFTYLLLQSWQNELCEREKNLSLFGRGINKEVDGLCFVSEIISIELVEPCKVNDV